MIAFLEGKVVRRNDLICNEALVIDLLPNLESQAQERGFCRNIWRPLMRLKEVSGLWCHALERSLILFIYRKCVSLDQRKVSKAFQRSHPSRLVELDG